MFAEVASEIAFSANRALLPCSSAHTRIPDARFSGAKISLRNCLASNYPGFKLFSLDRFYKAYQWKFRLLSSGGARDAIIRRNFGRVHSQNHLRGLGFVGWDRSA